MVNLTKEQHEQKRIRQEREKKNREKRLLKTQQALPEEVEEMEFFAKEFNEYFGENGLFNQEQRNGEYRNDNI